MSWQSPDKQGGNWQRSKQRFHRLTLEVQFLQRKQTGLRPVFRKAWSKSPPPVGEKNQFSPAAQGLGPTTPKSEAVLGRRGEPDASEIGDGTGGRFALLG